MAIQIDSQPPSLLLQCLCVVIMYWDPLFPHWIDGYSVCSTCNALYVIYNRSQASCHAWAISHEKTKRHNNSSAFLTMIVKRVTGTHSSIIMAINKLYGWSLRSLSVGRSGSSFFIYVLSTWCTIIHATTGKWLVYIPRERGGGAGLFFSSSCLCSIFGR